MSVLVHTAFPGLSTVFMAAAAAVLLLFVARMLFLLARLWLCPARQEKENLLLSFLLPARPWARSLQWNTLPASLPFTLSLREKPSLEVRPRVGVGLSSKPQSLHVTNWHPPTGPQFQPPRESSPTPSPCPLSSHATLAPALYESPVPLSMAKIIMSRHTFRKPNPNRYRRYSTLSPSRPASPPQTTSHLYHSIA